jgi:hypothetical protein
LPVRLEKGVRQRGAVDGLEFRDAARAELVNHARDDFLARPGRSENQHRNVRFGGCSNPLEDNQHLFVAADHLAKALHRRRLVFGRDGRAAFEKRIEQLDQRLVGRTRGDVADGRPPIAQATEICELAAQFSTSIRSRPKVCISDSTSKLSSGARSDNAGCRRATAIEPGFETGFRDPQAPCVPTPSHCASRAEGQVIHRWRLRYRLETAGPTGRRFKG